MISWLFLLCRWRSCCDLTLLEAWNVFKKRKFILENFRSLLRNIGFAPPQKSILIFTRARNRFWLSDTLREGFLDSNMCQSLLRSSYLLIFGGFADLLKIFQNLQKIFITRPRYGARRGWGGSIAIFSESQYTGIHQRPLIRLRAMHWRCFWCYTWCCGYIRMCWVDNLSFTISHNPYFHVFSIFSSPRWYRGYRLSRDLRCKNRVCFLPKSGLLHPRVLLCCLCDLLGAKLGL